MKISRKIATLIALSVTASLLALGCGGKEDKKPAASAKSGPRVVKVVGKDAKPYQFMNEKKFDGYNADVMQIVQDKLKDKYKFEYATVDANAVFLGLQQGKYDMAVGNYYTSEERNKNYYHSNAVSFLSDLRLIVRKDSDIASLDDIAGETKKLAQINVADPRYNIVEMYNENHKEKPIKITGSGFENTADVLKSVATGQNDAAIYPLDGYDAVMRIADLPLKTVQTVGLFPVVYFYHMNDANKVLRDDVDVILKDLRKDGTLAKISQKWHNNDPFSKPGADKVVEVNFWKK